MTHRQSTPRPSQPPRGAPSRRLCDLRLHLMSVQQRPRRRHVAGQQRLCGVGHEHQLMSPILLGRAAGPVLSASVRVRLIRSSMRFSGSVYPAHPSSVPPRRNTDVLAPPRRLRRRAWCGNCARRTPRKSVKTAWHALILRSPTHPNPPRSCVLVLFSFQPAYPRAGF